MSSATDSVLNSDDASFILLPRKCLNSNGRENTSKYGVGSASTDPAAFSVQSLNGSNSFSPAIATANGRNFEAQ